MEEGNVNKTSLCIIQNNNRAKEINKHVTFFDLVIILKKSTIMFSKEASPYPYSSDTSSTSQAGGFHRFNNENGLSMMMMMNTTKHIHEKLCIFNKAKRQDSLKLKCLGLLPKWQINSEHSQSSDNQNDTWDGILREDALSVSGDRKMIRLEYVLSNIPEMVRHEYQRMFHREMEMAMLPKIYDTEWDSDSNSILRKYNQTTHRPEKLIVCPRRKDCIYCYVYCCCIICYTQHYRCCILHMPKDCW
jgi:hypothetical protein